MNSDLMGRIASEVRTSLDGELKGLKPTNVVLGGEQDDYVADRLREMRRLLKEPEWIEATDDDDRSYRCLAVTEPDVDLVLAYCPEKAEYCVIQGQQPPYTLIGIWGDPVGCLVAM